MTNYKKALVISFLIAFSTSFWFNFSFAERKLEVQIPGLTTTTLPALPDYIAAIFRFSLMIIGIAVFGALIYGGFRYLTSAGSPSAMSDARDQIFSAILGLIILFSAWLILNTINPELVILGEPGGVIGSVPESEKLVVTLFSDFDYSGDSLKIGKGLPDFTVVNWDTAASALNDVVSSIKIDDPNYVLVAFEHINFQGKAQLIELSMPKLDAHLNDQISSLVLIKKTAGAGKASLYDAADFTGSGEYPVAADFYYSNPNFSQITNTTENGVTRSFNNRASSITVEKDVIAILYNWIDYKGWARVVTKDDPNFNTCDDEDWCDYCAEVIGLPHCDCLVRVLGDSCWEDKPSSIQIVHGITVEGTITSTYSTENDCTTAGKKWCPKCSGYKINTWKADACVEPATGCGYICSTDCGAGGGACEFGDRFDWGTCTCVPSAGCLEESSLILTPTGLKKIEDLKEGDYVVGYRDGQKVNSKILEKSEHLGEFKLYFYEEYWFTGNHLVYEKDYKDAKPVSELSNITKSYQGKVYNIQTETRNYFGANDLLIHNK